ncbi:MAG: CehA/McbA family metallohydrolase [Bryobacteraceae bacterium]
MLRLALALLFTLLLVWAQRPIGSATLTVQTGPGMPSRIYLRKGNSPFRLTPVDGVLPLKSDVFYRDRPFLRKPDPAAVEVICRDQYHYLLLKGAATFQLPPGEYTLEAYRGFFYTPASESFTLKPEESRTVTLPLKPWTGVDPAQWITADDHIHLTRERPDDPLFLSWLEAEDLTVGNFLQLQRQMDAAPQYGFGPAAEARRGRYSIRSGHESRNEFWGHINILGPRRLIRPLSTGLMYANTPESYPFPSLLFAAGRREGATVGYAHFFQPPQHSAIYIDAVLGNIDFVEVFQFGVLKLEPWYELLNAGLKVTGIAGSDFPVNLNGRTPWPNWLPLIGPERAVTKAPPGRESSYETWARAVRDGAITVTNGPIVELSHDRAAGTATARAAFFRPLEAVEIVRNGEVIAAGPGPEIEARIECPESCWIAARTRARKLPGDPESLPVLQAHTNPVYVLRDGKPVHVPAARASLAAKLEAEVEFFRSAEIRFPGTPQRDEFFETAAHALAELREP